MAVVGQKLRTLCSPNGQSLVFGVEFLVVGYVGNRAPHLVSFWVPAGMHAILLRPAGWSADVLRPESSSAKILAPGNGVATVVGP